MTTTGSSLQAQSHKRAENEKDRLYDAGGRLRASGNRGSGAAFARPADDSDSVCCGVGGRPLRGLYSRVARRQPTTAGRFSGGNARALCLYSRVARRQPASVSRGRFARPRRLMCTPNGPGIFGFRALRFVRQCPRQLAAGVSYITRIPRRHQPAIFCYTQPPQQLFCDSWYYGGIRIWDSRTEALSLHSAF